MPDIATPSRRRVVAGLAGLATLGTSLTLAAPRPARAATAEVVDVAGRRVRVPVDARRILLGEGRQTYLVAALDREDPFARVVGWRDDLRKADLDGYEAYRARWPAIDALPTFGGIKDGTFDIEQAISLRPEVVVMNLEAKPATDGAGLIGKLAAAGIPLVFIDFRERPFEHAEASIRLMGTILGRDDRAEALVRFRAAQVARVAERLAAAPYRRPRVMIERAAGYDESCCMSFGNENFGRMATLAGGRNIAEGVIPGTFGTLNPEQVIVSDPEVVIVTGANWELYTPGGQWVGVGPGADPARARDKLRALMRRPAYRTLPVARSGRVHAIWHQFYDSPYQFAAVQAMATWLQPELFRDLDPEATFREFHERFLPLPYRPGYWVSLAAGA